MSQVFKYVLSYTVNITTLHVLNILTALMAEMEKQLIRYLLYFELFLNPVFE